MRTNTSSMVLHGLLGLLALVVVGPVSAGVIYQEHFSYRDGPLGLQGGWFDTSQVTISNEVAIHSGAGNGPTGTFNAKRDIAPQGSSTTWIALRSKLDFGGPPPTAWGGLGLYAGGTSRLTIGKVVGQPSRWAVVTNSGAFAISPTTISSSDFQLVLLKFSFGGFLDEVEMWIDPADPHDLGPAHADLGAFDLDFNRIALRGGNSGSISFAFDSIEIASSINDLFPPECPTDFNEDGATDFGDLLLLLAAWGPCGGCIEDADDSGAVDFGDLLLLLAAWGPC